MKKLFAVFALILGISFFAACSEEPPTYYTVTFVQDGQEDIVKTVEGGKGLAQEDIPTLVGRTGYSVAWEEVDLSNISKDITVRAIYTANSYFITYNVPIDATLHETTQTVAYNSAYTLAEPAIIKHVQFKGWYLNLEDETTKFESGNAWNLTNNVTLYAKWQEDAKVTITFKQKGFEDVVKTIYRGEALPASEIPTPVEVEGYDVFWRQPTFTNVREDLIVESYEVAKEYTVTYSAEGDINNNETSTVKYGAACELLPPLERENYVFLGWFTEDGTKVENGSIWTIASDVTLIARWQEVTE